MKKKVQKKGKTDKKLEKNGEKIPKAGEKKGLKRKQALFVSEYCKDLNATQAALRAGYSKNRPDRAGEIGYQLLQKPPIKEAVDAKLKEIADKCDVTVEFVLNGLMENYRRAMTLVEVLDKEGKPTGVFEYEGAVANRALELMGKHLAMFTDNLKVDKMKPLVEVEDASTRRKKPKVEV